MLSSDWQMFSLLCLKDVSLILQVLPSPRFACLNCIRLEVIEPKCCQMLIFCQLGSLQPHMQLPSPSPWTEVCIFPCIKTGSNLGQCSGNKIQKFKFKFLVIRYKSKSLIIFRSLTLTWCTAGLTSVGPRILAQLLTRSAGPST